MRQEKLIFSNVAVKIIEVTVWKCPPFAALLMINHPKFIIARRVRAKCEMRVLKKEFSPSFFFCCWFEDQAHAQKTEGIAPVHASMEPLVFVHNHYGPYYLAITIPRENCTKSRRSEAQLKVNWVCMCV